MTTEEKVEKIKSYCDNLNRDGVLRCDKCPLYVFPEDYCYEKDANIDRNYAVLFGDSPVEDNDPVNRPKHYTAGGIECLDAIAASMTPIEYVGFLKGQVLKYIWRYRLKGKPAEDLKKARFYLDRLIQITEKEASASD